MPPHLLEVQDKWAKDQPVPPHVLHEREQELDKLLLVHQHCKDNLHHKNKSHKRKHKYRPLKPKPKYKLPKIKCKQLKAKYKREQLQMQWLDQLDHLHR